MKFLYKLGLFAVTAFGIYFCYHYATALQLPFFSRAEFKRSAGEGQPPVIQNIVVDEQGNILEMSHEVKETDLPASSVDDTLTCDTKYVVREYDRTTKSEESITETIPDQFIGKTRAQVEEIIENYNTAPALKDLERGFASMEIAAFSPEKLVVLKKFDSDMSREHFYLIAEDNLITVYYGDLATVYLYTDISMDALPDDLKQEILDKKFIESEEELYNFLESYSS
ncbi:MAG: hypothetical protein IJ711_11845 [Lachnospiraceae bacterium]|nr:hypothetical protein [Lachnospiraceae bacterium]